MAATGAIKAGAAFVELFLKDQVAPGLEKAKKRFKSFGEGLTKVGTPLAAAGSAITGTLGLALGIFGQVGEQIDTLSQRTGIGAEQLTALGYAAEQSQASIEGLGAGLGKMAKLVTAATAGNPAALKALAGIGLTMDDIRDKSPADVFATLADRIAGIEDPLLKLRVAQQFFGKGANELLPLLSRGSAGINELVNEAREMGVILGSEEVAAGAAFHDMLGRIYRQLTAVAVQIGAALGPALQTLGGLLSQAVKWTIDFVKSHQGLVMTVALAGGTLLGLGAGLLGLGVAFQVVSFAVGTLATIAGGCATVLGLFPALIAAIASPIGLVIAAVAALGVGFFTLTATGRGMVASLLGSFQKMFAFVQQVIGGVFTAIAAGRWDLAGKILMDGLYIAWQTGLLKLWQGWQWLYNGVLNLMSDLGAGISRLLLGGLQDVIRTLREAGELLGLDLGLKSAEDWIGGVLAAVKEGADDLRKQREAVSEAATQPLRESIAAAQRDMESAIAQAQRAKAAMAAQQQKTVGEKTAVNFASGKEKSFSAGSFSATAAGLLTQAWEPLEKTNELLGSIDGKLGQLIDREPGDLAFE